MFGYVLIIVTPVATSRRVTLNGTLNQILYCMNSNDLKKKEFMMSMVVLKLADGTNRENFERLKTRYSLGGQILWIDIIRCVEKYINF